MGEVNLLTGNGERMSPPVLTPDQHDALMTLLEGKSYSEHLHWNGREYFRDGGLWVVAWRGPDFDSGDPLDRPADAHAAQEAALANLPTGAPWKPKFNRDGTRRGDA